MLKASTIDLPIYIQKQREKVKKVSSMKFMVDCVNNLKLTKRHKKSETPFKDTFNISLTMFTTSIVFVER